PGPYRAAQEVFRSVAEKLRPCLVRIETVGGTRPPPAGAIDLEDETAPEEGGRKRAPNPFRDQPGSGFDVADGPTTGLIYSPDGYIVTSSFNFVRRPLLITVTLADGRRLAADLIARDQVRKIALLKVEAENLPVPRWRDVRGVDVGEWVVALGLGFGGDRPSIHVGILSAHHRMMGNAFQTDAKLNPANYGGPVCDLDGNVLGLAVPMAQRPGELAGIEFYDSGIGFAVPKQRLDEIVSVLKTGRSFYRGWLGIQMDPEVRDAVVVGRVADPSPMREAGVGPGDRILSINGKRIRHFGDLVRALYMIPAGEEVTVELENDGRRFTVTVLLARSEDLGPMPEAEEPFDPSAPMPPPKEKK
ncbi:MAG: PDZ domain-containing protein, partial [Planctomycetota bacterium]